MWSSLCRIDSILPTITAGYLSLHPAVCLSLCLSVRPSCPMLLTKYLLYLRLPQCEVTSKPPKQAIVLYTAGALTKEGIPFVPAVGTMMLWMDLRKGLRGGNTWEAERALWKRLADNRHVILTPGRLSSRNPYTRSLTVMLSLHQLVFRYVILTPGHLSDLCCLVSTHAHDRLAANGAAGIVIRLGSLFALHAADMYESCV